MYSYAAFLSFPAWLDSSKAFKSRRRDRRPVIGKSSSVVFTPHCLSSLCTETKLKNWDTFEWRALVDQRCRLFYEFATVVMLRHPVKMRNVPGIRRHNIVLSSKERASEVFTARTRDFT